MASESENNTKEKSEIASGDEISTAEEENPPEKVLVDDPVLCYLMCMTDRRPDRQLENALMFFTEQELDTAKTRLLTDGEAQVRDLAAKIKAKHKPSFTKKATDASDLVSILRHIMSKGGKKCLPIYAVSNIFRVPAEDPTTGDPKSATKRNHVPSSGV